MLRRNLLLALFGSTLSRARGSDSLAWITSLGGHLKTDSKGEVIAINLRGTWVNDVELIEVGLLPHLGFLDLSHTRISDEGMRHLKTGTNITELKLYYAEQITDAGMLAIKGWQRLRRLDLRGTRISNGTLEVLSHLQQLEALDIANTQVTDNGMDYLITLSGLKELALGRNRAGGDADLSFLRMLPSLTYLDLSGAKPLPPDMGSARHRIPPPPTMSRKTLEAIAQLKNLSRLRLGFSGISSNDLQVLGALSRLERLGLENCARIDDSALPALLAWRNLKFVDLQETAMTNAGIRELRVARPALRVLYSPAAATKTAAAGV